MFAESVDPLVERSQRPRQPDAGQPRSDEGEPEPHAARERGDRAEDDRDDTNDLDPEVRPDVVLADREDEADGGEQERRRTAERALENHRYGDRAGIAGEDTRPPVESRS